MPRLARLATAVTAATLSTAFLAPASLSAPFGQLVRARTEQGGGCMSWAVATTDIGRFERRLGREAVPGNRRFPDGRELSWRQIGIKGTLADPQLPFFVKWGEGSPHPSEEASTDVTISSLMIAGHTARPAAMP